MNQGSLSCKKRSTVRQQHLLHVRVSYNVNEPIGRGKREEFEKPLIYMKTLADLFYVLWLK